MGKFLLVVMVFAAVVYGIFWLIERRGRGVPRPAPRRTAPPTRRAVAPDDDEEFLRELERRRRRTAPKPKPDTGKPEQSDGDSGKGQSSPE